MWKKDILRIGTEYYTKILKKMVYFWWNEYFTLFPRTSNAVVGIGNVLGRRRNSELGQLTLNSPKVRPVLVHTQFPGHSLSFFYKKYKYEETIRMNIKIIYCHKNQIFLWINEIYATSLRFTASEISLLSILGNIFWIYSAYFPHEFKRWQKSDLIHASFFWRGIYIGK